MGGEGLRDANLRAVGEAAESGVLTRTAGLLGLPDLGVSLGETKLADAGDFMSTSSFDSLGSAKVGMGGGGETSSRSGSLNMGGRGGRSSSSGGGALKEGRAGSSEGSGSEAAASTMGGCSGTGGGAGTASGIGGCSGAGMEEAGVCSAGSVFSLTGLTLGGDCTGAGMC